MSTQFEVSKNIYWKVHYSRFLNHSLCFFLYANWFHVFFFQNFSSIKMNTRRFNHLQRNSTNGYFDALEYAIQCCEGAENTSSTTIYDQNHIYDFQINDGNRTALYKKCVMYKSKYNFFKFFECFFQNTYVFWFFFWFSFQINKRHFVMMWTADAWQSRQVYEQFERFSIGTISIHWQLQFVSVLFFLNFFFYNQNNIIFFFILPTINAFFHFS